jgi:hypothetical protein
MANKDFIEIWSDDKIVLCSREIHGESRFKRQVYYVEAKIDGDVITPPKLESIKGGLVKKGYYEFEIDATKYKPGEYDLDITLSTQGGTPKTKTITLFVYHPPPVLKIEDYYESNHGQEASIRVRLIDSITGDGIENIPLTLSFSGGDRIHQAITVKTLKGGYAIFKTLSSVTLPIAKKPGRARAFFSTGGHGFTIDADGEKLQEIFYEDAEDTKGVLYVRSDSIYLNLEVGGKTIKGTDKDRTIVVMNPHKNPEEILQFSALGPKGEQLPGSTIGTSILPSHLGAIGFSKKNPVSIGTDAYGKATGKYRPLKPDGRGGTTIVDPGVEFPVKFVLTHSDYGSFPFDYTIVVRMEQPKIIVEVNPSEQGTTAGIKITATHPDLNPAGFIVSCTFLDAAVTSKVTHSALQDRTNPAGECLLEIDHLPDGNHQFEISVSSEHNLFNTIVIKESAPGKPLTQKVIPTKREFEVTLTVGEQVIEQDTDFSKHQRDITLPINKSNAFVFKVEYSDGEGAWDPLEGAAVALQLLSIPDGTILNNTPLQNATNKKGEASFTLPSATNPAAVLLKVKVQHTFIGGTRKIEPYRLVFKYPALTPSDVVVKDTIVFEGQQQAIPVEVIPFTAQPPVNGKILVEFDEDDKREDITHNIS